MLLCPFLRHSTRLPPQAHLYTPPTLLQLTQQTAGKAALQHSPPPLCCLELLQSCRTSPPLQPASLLQPSRNVQPSSPRPEPLSLLCSLYPPLHLQLGLRTPGALPLVFNSTGRSLTLLEQLLKDRRKGTSLSISFEGQTHPKADGEHHEHPALI